jgi:hypothetical protein
MGVVRRSVEVVLDAVWISFGGYTCHLTAIRVWLAFQGQGKR